MPWKPPSGGAGYKPRAGNKSIRGRQISGPIPIPDPLDEEFPMRDQAGTVIALPDASNTAINRSSLLQARPTREEAYLIEDGHFRTTTSSGSAISLNGAQNPDFVSGPAVRSSIITNSPTVSRLRKSYPGSDILDNGLNGRDGEARPQRRKSTFRSALSRLFGRKKKFQYEDEDTRSGMQSAGADVAMANRQHRSDPTGDRRDYAAVEQPSRSASMPPGNHEDPLRSHSIGPDDMMVVQSARNSISADARLSGAFSGEFDPAAHPWIEFSKLPGLSPRPASSHDRASRRLGLSDGPGEIGQAVSGESHGLKRRSRSVSVLPRLDLPSSDQVTARRRSAEIRYWRESYAAPFMSPTSAMEDEAIMRIPTEDAEPSTIEEPKVLTPGGTRPTTPAGPRSTTQPSPESSSTAGSARPLGIDARVGSLETRMSRLESIVLQLGNSLPALRSQSKDRSRPSPPRQAQLHTRDRHAINSILLRPSDMGFAAGSQLSVSRPSTCHSDESKMTFGEVGDTTPRATVIAPVDEQGRPASFNNDKSRGADGSRKPLSENVSFEHYTNLLALLETERSAREALEAQVRGLGRQLQLMSKGFAFDPAEEQQTPSLNRSASEVSVFEDDDEDDDDDDNPRRLTATLLPRAPLVLEDSGLALETRSDEEYAESYATPAEMGSSITDVYASENEELLRSEARELSLSRLTMGQPLTNMQQISTRAM